MKLFTALENESIDIPSSGSDTLEEQIMAQNAVNNFNEAYFNRSARSVGFQLTGIPPEDMRKIRVITNRISDIISNIAGAINKRYKVAHSCLRYIEQSVNK